MTDIAHNWQLHVDIGPEWLFLHLDKTSHDADPAPPLAARGWEIADQYRIYRVVVELASSVHLTSHLVGQLVLLFKRCHRAGGVMRICGFSDANYDVLKIMQLAVQLPNYHTRRDAVMGIAPDSD